MTNPTHPDQPPRRRANLRRSPAEARRDALDSFVDQVLADLAARDESDKHLRTVAPSAATALDRARAAAEADNHRRLAQAEADAHRHHAPHRPPPAGGPPSYAEIAATVDRNERERLAAWEAAMERHHHRQAQQLARAERLVTTEHQLRTQPPPPTAPVRHTWRVRRNPVITAWIWFRVLLLLGVIYTLALACVITIGASLLTDEPTAPAGQGHPLGVTP